MSPACARSVDLSKLLQDALQGGLVMRGRKAAGPEYVELLPGSASAKERLKALLEVMTGTCRLFEACERLDICEQRFHQLREDWLNWSLQGLEPQKPGRKPQVLTPEQKRIRELEERVADLELELRAARAREEIALILPQAQSAQPTQLAQPPADEKKTRRRGRPPKPRPPANDPRPSLPDHPPPDCPPGTRKNT
jgi:hypothetical protein